MESRDNQDVTAAQRGGAPPLAWLAMIIAIFSFGASATRADIVQPSGFVSSDMTTYFGQSFTATLAEPIAGTLSFKWAASNLAEPDPVMSADIFSGFGFGGALLGTSDAVTVLDSLAAGEWVNFTFSSGVPLTAGNEYSIRFSYVGVGLRSGGFTYVNTVGDDIGSFYFGGHRLTGGGSAAADPGISSDLAFRVLTSVPEAQSWLMLGAAAFVGGTASGMRRFVSRWRVSRARRR